MNKTQTAFAAVLVLTAVFFIVLTVQPAALHALMPDGEFESLTPQNEDVFRALFAFLALAVGLKAWLSIQRWDMLTHLPGRLAADLRALYLDLRPRPESRLHLTALTVIMLSALAARLPHLNRFMLHDEAYTAVAFATSLRAALTDYHLPNNHVFHSLLVHFSTTVLGFAPWAVRLPTFIAGLLVIPAVYWVGLRYHSRPVGLLAALLAAFSPTLVSAATDARGYSLLILLTLLAFVLADFVRLNRNLVGWGLLSLLCALGFFTVPVMLFPFGILYAWLFFEHLVNPAPAYPNHRNFFLHWGASGLGAAILTLLLYTPIFIYTGPAAVFNNNFVASMPWDVFDDYLPFRIAETWGYWTAGVPPLLVGILVLGVILSFVVYPRTATHRFPLPLAAALWLILLLLLRRPDPHGKIWGYLNPLVLIWSAAGWGYILSRVHLPFPPRWSLLRMAFFGGMAAALAASGVSILTIPARWADMGPMNRLVLDLKTEIQPADGILAATPDDAPLWYYARLYGIPAHHFSGKQPYQRLLVIVNTSLGQTPQSVLTERAPNVTCTPTAQNTLLIREFYTVYVCPLP